MQDRTITSKFHGDGHNNGNELVTNSFDGLGNTFLLFLKKFLSHDDL